MFIADGSTLQIVFAACVSMSAMILYGVTSPFVNDDDDKLATFAQLMTFLQLFAAILLATDALNLDDCGDDAMCRQLRSLFGVGLVCLNVLVPLFSVIEWLLAAMGQSLEELDLGDLADNCEALAGFVAPCLGGCVGVCVCCKVATKEPTRRKTKTDDELLDDLGASMTVNRGSEDVIQSRLLQMVDGRDVDTVAAPKAPKRSKRFSTF